MHPARQSISPEDSWHSGSQGRTGLFGGRFGIVPSLFFVISALVAVPLAADLLASTSGTSLSTVGAAGPSEKALAYVAVSHSGHLSKTPADAGGFGASGHPVPRGPAPLPSSTTTTSTLPGSTTTTTASPSTTTPPPVAPAPSPVPNPSPPTTTTSPPTTTLGSSSPSNAASVLGVYAGPASSSDIALTNSVVGHKVRYAMDFLDGSSWATISDPSWFLSQWQGTGYQMIWGVPMLPNSGASLAVGATGAYDSYFQALASAFVSGGQGASIIRLGWEFNGSWFPWAAGGQATAFVQYWRQIVTTMQSVSGANFQFEWNPTRGDMGVGNLANYYPGNAYVSIIGLDVYDLEWGSYPGPQAEWQHMLTQSYGLDWLASFGASQGKPLAFPEWGLGWNSGGMVSGGDNAYFVEQMANWIDTHNVVNAILWDYGSGAIPNSAGYPNATAALATSFS